MRKLKNIELDCPSVLLAFFFSFALTCLISNNSQNSLQAGTNQYKPLLVFSGAQNLAFGENGTHATYDLKAPYPATVLFADLNTRLKKWKKLHYNFLDKQPISDQAGWISYGDETVSPAVRVEQWSEQWTNSAGDILWYIFQYIYPLGGEPQRNILHVTAWYIPSNKANVMQKDYLRVQPKLAQEKNNKEPTHSLDILLRAAAENGDLELVKILLQRGTDPNAADDFSFTALMAAAGNDHFDVAKILLDKGADVNAKDKQGIQALVVAVKKGHERIVDLLITRGADINARYSRKSLIQIAKENGQIKIADTLRKAGAKE